MKKFNWPNTGKIPSKSYKCGHCGNKLAAEKGFYAQMLTSSHTKAYIYICHFCTRPTFFDDLGKQVPGAKNGTPVQHINKPEVEKLFLEANDCFTIGAYTSAVICCRKLLMNISVEQGAKEGKSFAQYVNFLNDNNFIPPNGKDWVDSIRKLGNEANHNIKFKSFEEAKLILTFTEMLLRFIYEMPGLMKINMNHN